MATNYIKPGNVLTVTSPLDLDSGDPVLIGKIFGVNNFDAGVGLMAEISVTGVWSLPKAPTIVVAVGDYVYFDNTAGQVTSVVTANHLIGVATAAAAASDTTAAVRLNGVAIV
jgi:predicted RecA/RadA family phage recombinase